ncbi:apoptosis regulator BAX-like isoform X4 [Rhineura floridana]|nr:apoptosis regulator BAX-like isoform X4 [Rhineura floridana]XP_061447334.1 apoptosis regulator BAX-like isoform X4 [Rhineura floridana]XP_061447335.1 apoptosis regulator BAX-like isoform X4 [Rhineura floridana]XP_061447337.1 apoptosis regulator BAX-like isoform X4 [Rhineura floridana]
MAGPAPGSPDAGAWPSFAYGLRIAASHGTSDSFSAILRIGRALLHGFIQALFHPQAASVEQLTEEDISVEQQSGEDVVDSDRVTSLKDCMLRIWQELSSNPEIASMTESVSGDNPLNVLAEVSEHTFETGINWGRIVVFFYFSYKVIAKSNWFEPVMDWAMGFLRDRLAAWIQQQGGWIAMLNYSTSSS